MNGYKSKTLQEGWERYKKILPKDAGAAQISETRLAFYAGAMYCFNLVTEITIQENEEASMLSLDGLQAEIELFTLEAIARAKP